MQQLSKAIEILKNGGIVIFPTDTVCAISCRIDNVQAVKRLFDIKGRLETKATPVFVDSIDMAEEYVEPIPTEVRKRLLEKYWPGGLTVIFPCKVEKIPPLVRGGGETVALRMPKSDLALSLIRSLKVPIIGTSANFAGERTPVSTDEVDRELKKMVDFVLPGKSLMGQSSTIIDVSENPWKIIREGALRFLI